MANQVNNRYALFASNDENVAPQTNTMSSLSRNLFLDQVADDSGPWQEVKKRGAPAVQPPAPRGKTRNDYTTRARAPSASTLDNSDKAYDPYENWCGICSQKFGTKNALLGHIKQAPSDHKHYCNLCKRVFKDRNGLKNHV